MKTAARNLLDAEPKLRCESSKDTNEMFVWSVNPFI